MTRWGKPPSQTWRTFLENRAKEIVSIDFFTVSTATFRVLFVFSIRRECLDHVIVLSEKPLRRLLRSYLGYDHRARAHLGPENDCPDSRPVERPDREEVQSEPLVGGLHHRSCRRAARS
jgi:hypothetical protein